MLQDALKTALKSFNTKIAAQIDLMKNSIGAYIAEVLKHVAEFNEKFKEATNAEKDKF